MKHSLIILFFIHSICYSQSITDKLYKITYIMEFALDSTSSTYKEEATELLYQDGISYFWLHNQAMYDSLVFNAQEFNPLSLSTNQKFRIYKNHATNQILNYDYFNNLDPNVYYYEENKDNLNWEIIDETDSIGGYFCQKAALRFGNRVWYAWFAADVPIHDGPYVFCGLPGLIIKMNDSTDTWRFNLAAIEKEEKRVLKLSLIKTFDNAKRIGDKEEYFKMKRHFTDNAIELWVAQGLLILNEQLRKIANESNEKNAKANNNWIEKYPK